MGSAKNNVFILLLSCFRALENEPPNNFCKIFSEHLLVEYCVQQENSFDGKTGTRKWALCFSCSQNCLLEKRNESIIRCTSSFIYCILQLLGSVAVVECQPGQSLQVFVDNLQVIIYAYICGYIYAVDRISRQSSQTADRPTVDHTYFPSSSSVLGKISSRSHQR